LFIYNPIPIEVEVFRKKKIKILSCLAPAPPPKKKTTTTNQTTKYCQICETADQKKGWKSCSHMLYEEQYSSPFPQLEMENMQVTLKKKYQEKDVTLEYQI